jgi:RNA polymerase sigma-70 factor (ECF subfamily)
MSAPVEAVAAEVGSLFRREHGRLVAILARHFGARHLPLVEDVVQDALLKAMQVWPFTGLPDNPSAWLLQTAKNRALDHTRRSAVWLGKQRALVPLLDDCLGQSRADTGPQFEDEIRDSQLRMIFVCCHPAIPREAQVALALKTLCGFGEHEIAAAFLEGPDATAKRLVRARRVLRGHRVAVELPRAAELAGRVGAVLQTLYLLFNEGYKSSSGERLLREELCDEAIRLGELLAGHPLGDRGAVHALLALMHFHRARLPARLDDSGNLLLLEQQNRAKWDRGAIARGFAHMRASQQGAGFTRYHLEAGLAAAHALAPDFAATDWPRILALYDTLLALNRSPVVALNRVVALARVRGAKAALRELDALPGRGFLERHHLLHAVAGTLHAEAGDAPRATAALRRALALAPTPAERGLLKKRLRALRR